MSKYEPLQVFLENSKNAIIPMSFSEIEGVLGFKLPPSSRRHRAWWSNNSSNNVMTEAWVKAGYITEDVDLTAEKLKFSKANDNMPILNAVKNLGNKKPSFASIFGALKGQMIIMPEVDLTEPLWESEEDEITN